MRSGLHALASTTAQKSQVQKLRFLQGGALGDVNAEIRWQIARAINPRRKRAVRSLRSAAGAQYHPERTRPVRKSGPPFQKPSATRWLTLRLIRVAHPEELKVRILEEEAATCRALSWVLVSGSFCQSDPTKRLGRRFRVGRAKNEDVVELCDMPSVANGRQRAKQSLRSLVVMHPSAEQGRAVAGDPVGLLRAAIAR
jgi:hypothetical protein